MPPQLYRIDKAVQAIDVLLNVQRTVCRTGEHVAIRLSEETAAMMKNIMEKRITDKEFYVHMKEVHGTKCRICGLSPVVYHHLIPLCDGGDNKDGNIIPLCKYHHKKVHGCIDRKGYTDKGGTGRRIKRADNWQEILLLWAHSEIGTSEAKSKLGISTKSHITDKKWAKEYLQSIGIEKVHNTVDVKKSKKKRDIENRRIGHFCL